MKRVFYSAYVGINENSRLPAVGTMPLLLSEHRLYQADWLMWFYGFKAAELLREKRPSFHLLLDPKCDWAVRHLENFPVEVMTADYYALLRVPGLGVTSARRICRARRYGRLQFDDLKKMGVVLKRAMYFITCQGKVYMPFKMQESFITTNLLGLKEGLPENMVRTEDAFRQLNLFDDFHLQMPEMEVHAGVTDLRLEKYKKIKYNTCDLNIAGRLLQHEKNHSGICIAQT